MTSCIEIIAFNWLSQKNVVLPKYERKLLYNYLWCLITWTAVMHVPGFVLVVTFYLLY